jgi:hypothetical protein
VSRGGVFGADEPVGGAMSDAKSVMRVSICRSSSWWIRERPGSLTEERSVSNFVFAFRSARDQTADAAEEAVWGTWFNEIGANIAEFGHRVGETRPVGNCGEGSALSGYLVVNADDLASGVALANGCPGLQHGGGVELGTTVPMT